MEDEFHQIKIDIGDLKTNVSVIKNEVTDMKQSVTNAIDKISNSMAVLAAVTEKLNYNEDAHKIINTRLTEIEEEQSNQHDKLLALKTSHDTCMDSKRKAEDDKKNSPLNKAKDKAVEYLFIVLVTLVIYVLLSHFSDYMKYMGNSGKEPAKPAAPTSISND